MAHKTMPWLLLTQLLLLALKITAKIPALIVFGDSTVDAGNNNQLSTILKSNYAPYGHDFEGGKPTGRFCNGRLPTDFISEALLCKPSIPAYLDPMYSIKDFATGVTFASAGSGYDNRTSNYGVIPLWKEMEYYKDYQKKLKVYLGDAEANEVLSKALHLMSLGTNDFVFNYYLLPNRTAQYTVEEYGNFLLSIAGNFITELYNLGARKVGINGIPPMGCLPTVRAMKLFSGGGCVEKYNKVARDFNEKFQFFIFELNKELPGIKLKFYNPYPIFIDMIQNPSKYGFVNVAVPCCRLGMLSLGQLCAQDDPVRCIDADKYVFWDSAHPTEKTNFFIADDIIKTALSGFL